MLLAHKLCQRSGDHFVVMVDFGGQLRLARGEQPELQEQQNPSAILRRHGQEFLRPLVGAVGGWLLQKCAQLVQPIFGVLVEQGRSDVVLVGEVGVERAAGESGRPADIADRNLRVSAFDEQLFGAGQKDFAGVNAATQRTFPRSP